MEVPRRRLNNIPEPSVDSALSERFAELTTEDLPGGRPRHGFHKAHFSRLLIAGEPFRDKGSNGAVHRFAGRAWVP